MWKLYGDAYFFAALECCSGVGMIYVTTPEAGLQATAHLQVSRPSNHARIGERKC